MQTSVSAIRVCMKHNTALIKVPPPPFGRNPSLAGSYACFHIVGASEILKQKLAQTKRGFASMPKPKLAVSP